MPVTINDIAHSANVSRSTVSLVLRNETEGRVSATTSERVRQIMLDMNYRPHAAARQMRGDRSKAVRTNCLGYLFHVETQPESHPYYMEVLMGANEEARLHNQHLLMGHGHACAAQLKAQILTLTGDKVDGWLLGALYDPDMIQFLKESRIPAVWAGSSMDTSGIVSQVRGDDFQGGYLATKHLTDLGHRRIVCVMQNAQAGWVEQMRTGCRLALREAGIKDFAAPVQFHHDDENQLHQLIDGLLESKKPPTALLVRGDRTAVDAMRYLGTRGLEVPRDISVVGYDGLALGEMSRPALTTVAAPRREIGKAAIQRLLEIIDAPEILPATTVLPVSLIERASTGPVAVAKRRESHQKVAVGA